MSNLNLYIKDEKERFSIIGNARKNTLEITGALVPYNSNEYFEPVHQWIENICLANENKSLTVFFKIFLASKSVYKHFYRIFRKLDEMVDKQGYEIKIYWFYEEGDNDCEEDGEDIKSYIVKYCHFRLVEVEELELCF